MADTAEEAALRYTQYHKDGASSTTHVYDSFNNGSSNQDKSFNFGTGNPMALSAQAALEKNRNN